MTTHQQGALIGFLLFIALIGLGLFLLAKSKRWNQQQGAERDELLQQHAGDVTAAAKARPLSYRQERKQREDYAAQAIRDLKAWRPAGSELIYLGVRMTVIGHSFLVPWDMYSMRPMPLITARYVDRCGTVRTIEIKWLEARRLMEAEAAIERAAAELRT